MCPLLGWKICLSQSDRKGRMKKMYAPISFKLSLTLLICLAVKHILLWGKKNVLHRRCEYGEKRIFLYYWYECKLIQPLWKTEWKFFKKFKIEPAYDPAIPLPGIQPRERISILKRYRHCHVYRSRTARRWNQQRCPSTDEGNEKMWEGEHEWTWN